MGPRVIYLQCLQPLGELAQGARGSQPLGRIAAAGGIGQPDSFAHEVNIG